MRLLAYLGAMVAAVVTLLVSVWRRKAPSTPESMPDTTSVTKAQEEAVEAVRVQAAEEVAPAVASQAETAQLVEEVKAPDRQKRKTALRKLAAKVDR
jgi:hypothetical protein